MNATLTEDIYCNATVELKDGSEINIDAYQLSDNNLHHWKDWHCKAGVTSIYIDDDFSVYAGTCKNDKLGNLFDENFSFLNDYTICKKEKCTECASDLYAEKLDKRKQNER
jgi:hypothetical protein